jgi:hypothetical protein
MDSTKVRQSEELAPEPRADIGILLIHGIGDHQEGQTLTAFGEPLLDWMSRWMRGGGKKRQRGELTVSEARLKAEGSPAYALAQLKMPVGGAMSDDASHSTPSAQERWLICEGWWGGSVQAPHSWNLLLWMWSRGPLLIYWHYYLAGVARGYKLEGVRPLRFIIPAFFLASFCQLAVGLAMLLWLIPIGPWRKGILTVVRVLTLTLGDSYVLLEQEIQHAALVERVRRSLDWLADRTTKIIVVAHSQEGAIAHEALQRYATRTTQEGAIAHEALQRDPKGTIESFISVGSGLEKLHFLRSVRGRHAGLFLSALVFPAFLITVGMFIGTSGLDAPLWQKALAWACAIGTFGVICAVYNTLRGYIEEAGASSDALALHKMHWLDLFATHDAVPMGDGSLLRKRTFLTQTAICNERSILHDHVTYFANYNDCLHRIWLEVADTSHLPLFEEEDKERLKRFGHVHGKYARLVAWGRITCFVAALVIGFLLRKELVGFGESVITTVKDSPAEDWLKPVRAAAGAAAWLVDRWGRPGPATAQMLTEAFFGGALLLGGILLWWAGFRAFWHWRCTARWHSAARGGDIKQTDYWRAARGLALCFFAIAGSLPLLISVLIWLRPAALTLDSLGRLIAGILSMSVLLFAIFFAVAGPWLDGQVRQDTKTPLEVRLVVAVGAAFLALVLTFAALALWPVTLGPSVGAVLLGAVYALIAVVWQCYAVLWHRQKLRLSMTLLIMLLPMVSSVVLSRGRWQSGHNHLHMRHRGSNRHRLPVAP